MIIIILYQIISMQLSELELTKDINDNDVDDYYNVFQTSWFIESLNDDGTFEPIKNAGTVGSDAEANKIGKTNFSLYN